MEKNECQNRVFLFSNFLGAAILNNCDVSWLLCNVLTQRALICLITKGQPFHITIQHWPGTLKTKIYDSIIHAFNVNALS